LDEAIRLQEYFFRMQPVHSRIISQKHGCSVSRKPEG